MLFFTKEVKIGITAVIAIVIIYVGIIFLKGLKLFSTDTAYYVEMDNANGLTVSGEVLANGVNIGLVKSISYVPEKQNIMVEIDVNPKFNIPQGTTAYLSKEMLGSPKLNLSLGKNSGNFLKPGDVMKAEVSADLMTAAGNMIPQIQALMPKLDSILTGVNALVNDPALNAALHNAESISANLKTTTDNVNRMLAKDMPSLLARTNNIAANLESTTSKIDKMDLTGMAENAEKTLDNINNITTKLDMSLGSKNNSLGMLINDNSLVLHMDTTIQNASLLLEDLRLNPKRYVHFSVFGKKQK